MDHDERVMRVQNAIADYLHNHVSNHGAKSVSRTIERLGGNPRDLWRHLQESGHDHAGEELDGWTSKRHQIVHQGEAIRVQRNQARNCVDLIAAIGNQVDIYAENAMNAG